MELPGDTPETQPYMAGSPRKRPAPGEAEAALERMLVDQQKHQSLGEEAPKWAIALHSSINGRLDKLLQAHEDLNVRMDHIEQKTAGDSERIHVLEGQVSELKRAVEEAKQGAASGNRADARRSDAADTSPVRGVSIPPPTSLGGRDETDFSHLIIGGWLTDTKRQVIESDLERFVSHMQVQDVSRTAAYGKRARVAHVHLRAVPTHEARSRFFELLPRINKKFSSTGGDVLGFLPPSLSQSVSGTNSFA